MAYLGSWKIDDVLYFYANTTRFDTGNATDADSDTGYRVYENETGTPLLTGSMSLLDSANTAGFYSEAITLSAANGFEKGKQYSIYKFATVNSVAGASHDTFQIEAEVDANVVSDKTGYALSSAGIQAIWDVLTSALTTVGSIGKLIVDNLNATISSRASAVDLATVAGYLDTEIADIKAKTDNLPADPADASDIAASFTTVNTKLDTIDDFLDTEVAAIKAKTDSLTFTVSGQVDANVQSINDAALTGDGSGTPWGPA